MKLFIKDKIRKLLFEFEANPKDRLTSLCNTMSVATYDEVIGRLIHAIGTKEENPDDWAKIEGPLSKLKGDNIQIGNEINTNHMSGDSMVDEANTWWAAIQSTFCK